MRVPLPQRGQPLDVTYINSLVTAINDITNAVAQTTYNFTTVDTSEAGRQSIQTGQSMIFAGATTVSANEYVVKDAEKTWYVDLPVGFKYAPNVVPAVVNTGSSTTGNNVVCTITNVTKSRVDGRIKYLSSGTASVSVNIHAIGIPE